MYRFIKSDFMRVAKENVCDMFDNSLPGRLMLAIIIIFIIIMPIIIYLDIKACNYYYIYYNNANYYIFRYKRAI